MAAISLKIMKGFTLIEIMVVISVVGILMVIAIPAYQIYVARAQVADTLMFLDGYKGRYAEYILKEGSVGNRSQTESILGYQEIQMNSHYVQRVYIDDTGNLVALFSNQANSALQNGQLILSPVLTGSSLYWQCTGNGVNQLSLPTTCR